METSYKKWATVTDLPDSVEISIPASKDTLASVFLWCWICFFWVGGEIFVWYGLNSDLGAGTSGLKFFMFLWLILWTLGGILVFSGLMYSINGIEVITVGNGQLQLNKKGMWLYKPKTYELQQIKKIRVQQAIVRRTKRKDEFSGNICFDYGHKTIRFAGGIDLAEAQDLLRMLRAKKLLKAGNFA